MEWSIRRISAPRRMFWERPCGNTIPAPDGKRLRIGSGSPPPSSFEIREATEPSMDIHVRLCTQVLTRRIDYEKSDDCYSIGGRMPARWRKSVCSECWSGLFTQPGAILF